MDGAKAALEKLAGAATKAGWTKRVSGFAFKRQPDSFDANHLPTPRKQ